MKRNWPSPGSEDMGFTDSSLKGLQGRQQSALVTPHGNYRRSAWGAAQFVYDNAGTFEPYLFTPGGGNRVHSLLFMNGKPIQMKPSAIYPATIQRDRTNSGETMRHNANVQNATGLITTTQTDLPPGEQAVGRTPTGDVPIKGYHTLMLLELHEIVLDGQCSVVMDALGDSGVISGPINYDGLLGSGRVSQDVNPIILHEADYTQAMRDAGDLISQVQGGVAVQYEIVGLFWEYIIL